MIARLVVGKKKLGQVFPVDKRQDCQFFIRRAAEAAWIATHLTK